MAPGGCIPWYESHGRVCVVSRSNLPAPDSHPETLPPETSSKRLQLPGLLADLNLGPKKGRILDQTNSQPRQQQALGLRRHRVAISCFISVILLLICPSK